MNFSFDNPITLENDFVVLRQMTVADIDNLLAIATRDRNLLQFSPSPIYNAQLMEEYVDKALRSFENRTRYTFSVFDKTKNCYAGSTSFLNISNEDQRLEIGGTWYGKKYQRTGLNRNCKYLMLKYAFEQLGAQRVEFRTDERNAASRQAVEKIGGQFEGILRSHTLMYDGFRRNTVCYSILKNEWDGLKNGVFFNF